MTSRCLIGLAAVCGLVTLSAQQSDQSLPRFRAGANLVRVDAYASAEGRAVTDLTAPDFEVLEDDVPQKVELFQVVHARGAGATITPSSPSSTTEQRDAVQNPEARVFVIYLDVWHVSTDGSAKALAPISKLLNNIIGPGDMVGVMTPEMTPQNMTLTRRGQGVEAMISDSWAWGQRDRLVTTDERESQYAVCYPDSPRASTAGIAKEMIERRREEKTLRSMRDLIGYLDTLRDERKFVVLLSEGWVLFGRNDRLGGLLPGQPVPGAPPVKVGPDGRLTTDQDEREEDASMATCERDRVMLAYIDHGIEVRQMAQRANRANVTFYPIDPRGLPAFDDAIGPLRPATPVADAQRLNARQTALRELAEQTDGAWVLNTNQVADATARILADTSSYYLLSYYSTNAKLDGRFRRITVRVKREGVDVRTRPGYLAPNEAETRAAGVTPPSRGGARALPSAAVSRALDRIAPGRGTVPVRIQASGVAGNVRTVIELDLATARLPEWATGGTLQLTFETERGTQPRVVAQSIAPGQRTITLEGAEGGLAPGRYIVRAELRAAKGAGPIRASTDATVPPPGVALGTSAIALRRGPTTGLAYQSTADPRFRRTERIRIEVPVFGDDALTPVARVLNRDGQPMQLQLIVSERKGETSAQRFIVAEAVLAPLAPSDYVFEVGLDKGRDTTSYGFRVVP